MKLLYLHDVKLDFKRFLFYTKISFVLYKKGLNPLYHLPCNVSVCQKISYVRTVIFESKKRNKYFLHNNKGAGGILL